MMTLPANTDILTKLIELLRKIEAPASYDSAWIGPFEQLVGAAFSLIESEKRKFSSRKYDSLYHPKVQCKIVSALEEFETGQQVEKQNALDSWLSGYYFNSGIQRINFAAERLIATFAALPCKCGTRPPEISINNHKPPNFQQRLGGAQTRLAHVKTEYPSRLINLEIIIGQFGSRYDRNHPFDSLKGLAMIRQHVNSRKHSVYRRAEVLDSLPRPASGTHTWSDAGCNEQMKTAVGSLELMTGAYSEVLAWFPLAKFS